MSSRSAVAPARVAQAAAVAIACAAALLLGIGPNPVAAEEPECPPTYPVGEDTYVDYEDLEDGTDVVACELVGAMVTAGDISVEVSPPGDGLVMDVLSADGEADSLSVVVSDDGESLADDGSVDTGTPVGDGCDNSSFAWNNTKVTKPELDWRIKFSSVPGNITNSQAQDAMQAAFTNWTHLDNPCNMADNFGKTVNFQGGSDLNSSVQPDGQGGNECRHRSDDLVSLSAFGDLDGSGDDSVAATCQNVSNQDTNPPYSTKSSDVKFNDVNYDWTVSPGGSCNNRYDLESVATHEYGHSWGLGDLTTGSLGLTMRTGALYRFRCNTDMRSLGRGDVEGIRARYPN